MKAQLFFIFVLWSNIGNGQNSIEGLVTDAQKERLPFVNILINDSPKDGVSTDIDGRFTINQERELTSLTFSYVGYEKLRIEGPFESPLTVQLIATSYDIATIEIIAGENPAHRIIRQVTANKALNDHEKLPAYQCQTYNKLNMGFIPLSEDFDTTFLKKDTSKARIKRQYEAIKKSHDRLGKTDMMLVESVSIRKFKAPKDLQEEVLHNKVSGFKELPLATFATDVQPFSFYDNNLFLFEQAYLNPISTGSTKKYFFTIEDTLYQQQDTVFIISFRPKKGKNFEGLKGLLYIHTHQYAIQNVLAEPADKTLAKFKIEQKYAWTNEQHWFPEQLNFEFFWDKFGYETYMSFYGYGKTYVSAVDFQPNFDKKTFKKAEHILFSEEAHTTSDSIWNATRLEPLTDRELATYRVIDSLGEAFKLDKWVRRLAVLGEGRMTIAGPIDWVFKNSIAFNNHEKVRLGIGLGTNDRLSESFELGGYYAYGFGDKEWKYGASMAINFDRYAHNTLAFWHQKDIAVPAIVNFKLSDGLFGPRFFSNLIDESTSTGVAIHSRPMKYLQSSISVSREEYQPRYEYNFGEIDEGAVQKYTEVGINLRYAYNEKFSRFLGYSVFEATNYPVFEINYAKGFKDILEGQYAYNKLTLSLEHQFHTRFFGATHYRIEAGIIDADLPLNRLFTGTSFGNTSVQLLSTTFRTMENFEFLSDRFLHFYFRQDFGSLLFKTKKIHPEIAIEHNIAFGSLSRPELQKDINFKTLESGFYEVGVVINNILRFNYLNMGYLGLGVGAFYRYGPNALPTFKENSQIQLTTTMRF